MGAFGVGSAAQLNAHRNMFQHLRPECLCHVLLQSVLDRRDLGGGRMADQGKLVPAVDDFLQRARKGIQPAREHKH